MLASAMVVTQIVKLGMLIHRRWQVKDYNRFVHAAYTQYAKETPAIILRIQDGNIQHYNSFLKRCRFLSVFFKEMDYFGQPPAVKMFDLFPVKNK